MLNRTSKIVIAVTAAMLASHSAVAQSTATAPAIQASAAAQKVVSQYIGTDGVTVARLENGLTVIIKPVKLSPVVDVRAVVFTGSLYEGKYRGAGVSHLLEHLVAMGAEHDMAGGAAAAPEAKKPSGRVQQIGGQSNAYTTLDHTAYFISASSGKTMECIDLIADWMARPTFNEADFTREHGVVQRELEMNLDVPARRMAHARMENVWREHPAAVPVIGYARPLANLTYADVRDYHARMYVPQNMIFSVVGDVDAPTVLSRVAQAFGGFDAGRATDHSLPEVAPLTGVRRLVLDNPAVKDVSEEIDFITIPLLHDDLYALDVLSYVLSQGQASRLVEKIQREANLVTQIDTGSYTPPWGKGSFAVHFRSDPDKADAAESAILAQLADVVQNGVSADELARAIRQKVADDVYARQTVESQAGMLVGDFLSTGNIEFSRQYTRRIEQVTAQQVQAVAKKYLTPDAMAVTRMTPTAGAVKELTAATQPSQPSEAQVFTLPNGLKVILRPTPGVGIVSIVFGAKGGVLGETPQTNGLGTLMSQLSLKGAGDMTARQIAEFFADAGGAINAEFGNNSTLWQATVLAPGGPKALDILADVVTKPTFAQSELDILRPESLATIDQQDEQWQRQLMKFFREKFFAGSPYQMLPSGQRDVVAKATIAQICDYHAEHVKAGSSVLTVFGEFDPSAMRATIEQQFAAVPAGSASMTIAPQVKIEEPGQYVLPTTNTTAGIIVARPGMEISSPDFFAMNVLDTIISGYQLPSGWLHDELRGKRLVYVVHAQNWAGVAPGAFFAFAGSEPGNAAQVVDIIQKNFRAAADYTPSQAEIDEAVNTILTAELLDNQEVWSLAKSAAINELVGVGWDLNSRLESIYRSIKPADVHRVGQKYLSGNYVVVVTTPKGK